MNVSCDVSRTFSLEKNMNEEDSCENAYDPNRYSDKFKNKYVENTGDDAVNLDSEYADDAFLSDANGQGHHIYGNVEKRMDLPDPTSCSDKKNRMKKNVEKHQLECMKEDVRTFAETHASERVTEMDTERTESIECESQTTVDIENETIADREFSQYADVENLQTCQVRYGMHNIENILRHYLESICDYLEEKCAPIVASAVSFVFRLFRAIPSFISKPIALIAAAVGTSTKMVASVVVASVDCALQVVKEVATFARTANISALLNNQSISRIGLTLISMSPRLPAFKLASLVGASYYAGLAFLLLAGARYAMDHEFEAAVSVFLGCYAYGIGLRAGQDIINSSQLFILHVLGSLAGQRIANTVETGARDLLEFAGNCGGESMQWCHRFAGRVDVCLNLLGVLALIVSGSHIAGKFHMPDLWNPT